MEPAEDDTPAVSRDGARGASPSELARFLVLLPVPRGRRFCRIQEQAVRSIAPYRGWVTIDHCALPGAGDSQHRGDAAGFVGTLPRPPDDVTSIHPLFLTFGSMVIVVD